MGTKRSPHKRNLHQHHSDRSTLRRHQHVRSKVSLSFWQQQHPPTAPRSGTCSMPAPKRTRHWEQHPEASPSTSKPSSSLQRRPAAAPRSSTLQRHQYPFQSTPTTLTAPPSSSTLRRHPAAALCSGTSVPAPDHTRHFDSSTCKQHLEAAPLIGALQRQQP
jgi:hypothetical protein